jgi:hypothetical protein
MKWFRALAVAAVLCVTVAIGIWGVYTALVGQVADVPAAIALAALFLAVVFAVAAIAIRVGLPSKGGRP